MTAYLHFEPGVPMVVLTIYATEGAAAPHDKPAASAHSLAARCFAWLLPVMVERERSPDEAG